MLRSCAAEYEGLNLRSGCGVDGPTGTLAADVFDERTVVLVVVDFVSEVCVVALPDRLRCCCLYSASALASCSRIRDAIGDSTLDALIGGGRPGKFDCGGDVVNELA